MLNIGDVAVTPSLFLENALLVPSFQFNLVSVSKLTKQLQCELSFLEDCCVMQDTALGIKETVGIQKEGLYMLDNIALGRFMKRREEKDVGKRSRSLSVAANNKAVYWHNRLGHVPVDKLVKLGLIKDVDIRDVIACDACHKARGCRLPFQYSEHESDDCFDLVHFDIWGLCSTVNHDGAVYLLRTKAEFCG